MSSSSGQKVTTDPQSQVPVQEGVGVVTSDSLAAESQAFGQGNPKAAPMKQSSHGTTTNNTDTSGATTLEPAPDAEAREAQEGWNESAQLKAGSQLGEPASVGPTYSSVAGSTGSTGGTSSDSPAPTGSYAGSAGIARNPGDLKPKGKNITEGGFDSDAPNASFNNTDIGGDKDPGRLAEKNMQLRDTESGPDAGSGPRQGGVTGEGVYDALSNDQQA